jgi:hypothetical protein
MATTEPRLNMHTQNIPSAESEQNFGKQFAAGLDSIQPDAPMGAVILVFATPEDYHQICPDLRHIPHERYLRSTAGGVTAAQRRGVPVMLKEVRARPYFAWLARHGLEKSIPHLFLYASFAPLLQDPALLAQLGFVPADSRLVHTPDQDLGSTDPGLAEAVEALAVKLAVSYRFNHCDNVLCLVYAMRMFAFDVASAAAMVALADRLATGMTLACVRQARADSMVLAADWHHSRLAGRN